MKYENIIVTIYIKFSNYISRHEIWNIIKILLDDFLTVSIKGFIRIMWTVIKWILPYSWWDDNF